MKELRYKLVISRRHWLTNARNETATSALYYDGYSRKRDYRQCCIGHFANKVLEVPNEYLKGTGNLNDVFRKLFGKADPKETDPYVHFQGRAPAELTLKFTKGVTEIVGVDPLPKGEVSSAWENRAIQINDNKAIKRSRKEELLIEHFKEIGVELSFVP